MVERPTSKAAKPTLQAEDLSICFVNTVAWRLREPNEERLGSPSALLEWLGRNGLAQPHDLRLLRGAWTAQPGEAAKAYEMAIQLRESIYTLFIACIARSRPPSSALAFLTRVLWHQPSGLRLEWERDRMSWHLGRTNLDPLDLLRPIALSAADLVTGSRTHKIRQCQDDRGCGWLFVDESRVQNRRWCSMGDCGNRAKARRHRERIRAVRE